MKAQTQHRGSGIAIDRGRLRRLREEKPWSREELAARTGLSVSSITKYENGEHSPRAPALGALCEALGCKPADLLGGEWHTRVLRIGPKHSEETKARMRVSQQARRARERGDSDDRAETGAGHCPAPD